MLRTVYLMAQIPDHRRTREQSFGFLIQTIARRLDAEMKKELAEIDLDLKLFANLMVLAEQDGINQSEIGKRLNFPEYYTSRAVDALVQAGYVERQPDPHSRRTNRIFLTEEGRTKANLLPAIVQRVNDKFLANLDDEERETVMGLLRKMMAT